MRRGVLATYSLSTVQYPVIKISSKLQRSS